MEIGIVRSFFYTNIFMKQIGLFILKIRSKFFLRSISIVFIIIIIAVPFLWWLFWNQRIALICLLPLVRVLPWLVLVLWWLISSSGFLTNSPSRSTYSLISRSNSCLIKSSLIKSCLIKSSLIKSSLINSCLITSLTNTSKASSVMAGCTTFRIILKSFSIWRWLFRLREIAIIRAIFVDKLHVLRIFL